MAPTSAPNVHVGTKVFVQEDSSKEWLKGVVKGQDEDNLVVSTSKGERRVTVSAAPLQNSEDEPVEVSRPHWEQFASSGGLRWYIVALMHVLGQY